MTKEEILKMSDAYAQLLAANDRKDKYILELETERIARCVEAGTQVERKIIHTSMVAVGQTVIRTFTMSDGAVFDEGFFLSDGSSWGLRQLIDSVGGGPFIPQPEPASAQSKPSIAELEAMLSDSVPHKIKMKPDGSITTEPAPASLDLVGEFRALRDRLANADTDVAFHVDGLVDEIDDILAKGVK